MTGGSAQAGESTRKRDYAQREQWLWAEFSEHQGAAQRNALIEHYYGWTHVVARDIFHRLRVPGAEWADYVHYATIGLIECIDRFDPARGVYFQTFARHRLRGAILNNIGKFAERTGHEFDASARYAERAESLNEAANDDALHDVIELSVGLAIGYLLELGTLPSGSPPENEAYRQAETESLIISLKKMVAELPEKERQIITGHYFQQLPFIEIAGLMQLTKGRISQLHSQAIRKLRNGFEENDSLLSY